jgi:hypothetical protein
MTRLVATPKPGAAKLTASLSKRRTPVRILTRPHARLQRWRSGGVGEAVAIAIAVGDDQLQPRQPSSACFETQRNEINS